MQRYRIFFSSRTWTLVIHSFKSQNRVFFFPRSGKKIQLFFFFSRGKVHRSFNHILMKFPFFLIKVACIFFLPNFCVFFCFFSFPRKSSSVIHSFDFFGGKKKTNRKKKTAFSFIYSIFLKNAKKRTFPGK